MNRKNKGATNESSKKRRCSSGDYKFFFAGFVLVGALQVIQTVVFLAILLHFSA